MRDVVRSTQFTDRISVNGTGETVVLTIDEVEVADEVEFICLVKSLTDGVGEGRTQLKVFGKTQPGMTCCFLVPIIFRMIKKLLNCCAEKPDVTTIEGVRTGILVNIGGPSKVDRLQDTCMSLDSTTVRQETYFFLLLTSRSEPARSKMDSPGRTSRGTETVFNFAMVTAVRHTDIHSPASRLAKRFPLFQVRFCVFQGWRCCPPPRRNPPVWYR